MGEAILKSEFGKIKDRTKDALLSIFCMNGLSKRGKNETIKITLYKRLTMREISLAEEVLSRGINAP